MRLIFHAGICMNKRPSALADGVVTMSKWLSLHHRIKFRKWTSAVHIAAGVFCGILYHWYPGLAVSLFAGFAWFEWWEAKLIKDQGHRDFWEGLLGYFVGGAIILILKIAGVI